MPTFLSQDKLKLLLIDPAVHDGQDDNFSSTHIHTPSPSDTESRGFTSSLSQALVRRITFGTLKVHCDGVSVGPTLLVAAMFVVFRLHTFLSDFHPEASPRTENVLHYDRTHARARAL